MKKNNVFLLVLVLVACCSQFASDIYVPAMLSIATYMNTNISYIQLSIPIYLFGVATTQLIYGPLSEGLGRKKPLIIGLFFMLCGTTICIFSHDATTLLIGRLLQGVGGGATACLWRSVFRDMYTGKELSIIGGYLSIIFTFVVPAAPLIGGLIQKFINWQAIFGFILLYNILTILSVIILYKETNIHKHISKLNIKFILKSYISILTNKTFITVTLFSFLMYGAMFAWLTSGSVTLIKYANISPLTFGWFNFLGCGFAYGLAGKINGKLVHKYGINHVLNLSFKIILLSGIILLLTELIFGLTFISVAISITLFYFGISFVWPNAFAVAFSPFGHIAGYAGAMYGCLQLAGGAILGGIVTKLPHTNLYSVSGIIILVALISLSIFKLVPPQQITH